MDGCWLEDPLRGSEDVLGVRNSKSGREKGECGEGSNNQEQLSHAAWYEVVWKKVA